MIVVSEQNVGKVLRHTSMLSRANDPLYVSVAYKGSNYIAFKCNNWYIVSTLRRWEMVNFHSDFLFYKDREEYTVFHSIYIVHDQNQVFELQARGLQLSGEPHGLE